ncbi:hypothetical protein PGTUg99_033264 [Puccinia graminis f. sp. tritici]|uniref:Uncharacterized protein n=1 Tax=Puccinia graminis f. sp. tritici TaxID=56615 RepID=A0A5B0Q957_PUCGR|nr:hypothetical protein PGTUg99_033264 [Puccinia graminis f. sp. tritici]
MGDLNSFGLGVILVGILDWFDYPSPPLSIVSRLAPRRVLRIELEFSSTSMKTAAIECASPSSTVDKPKDPLVQLFDLDSWISDDPQPIRF